MIVHAFCNVNEVDKTIKRLKKDKMFSDVIKLDIKNAIKLVTNTPIYYDEIDNRLKIENKLIRSKTIRSFVSLPLRNNIIRNMKK